MSQPIRYGLADADLGRIHPQADGHLVMWADYAKLQAENYYLKGEKHPYTDLGSLMPKYLLEHWVKENARLKADLTNRQSEADRLKAEVERLRKAGDEMMEVLESEIPFTAMNAVNGWLAAKEGGAK